MSYGTIIDSKLSNALFADAEPNDRVPGVVSGELHRFKKRQGGLWVGGTATLTDTHLLFGANAINDAIHKGGHAYATPLAEITAVEVKSGFLTRIIDVTTKNGATFSFRCFGAAAFAEKIRRQAKLV